MSHAFRRETEMETEKLFISFCEASEQRAASTWTAGRADTSHGSDQREQDKSICAERNSRYSLSSLGTAAGAEASPLIQKSPLATSVSSVLQNTDRAACEMNPRSWSCMFVYSHHTKAPKTSFAVPWRIFSGSKVKRLQKEQI